MRNPLEGIFGKGDKPKGRKFTENGGALAAAALAAAGGLAAVHNPDRQQPHVIERSAASTSATAALADRLHELDRDMPLEERQAQDGAIEKLRQGVVDEYFASHPDEYAAITDIYGDVPMFIGQPGAVYVIADADTYDQFGVYVGFDENRRRIFDVALINSDSRGLHASVKSPVQELSSVYPDEQPDGMPRSSVE